MFSHVEIRIQFNYIRGFQIIVSIIKIGLSEIYYLRTNSIAVIT